MNFVIYQLILVFIVYLKSFVDFLLIDKKHDLVNEKGLRKHFTILDLKTLFIK